MKAISKKHVAMALGAVAALGIARCAVDVASDEESDTTEEPLMLGPTTKSGLDFFKCADEGTQPQNQCAIGGSKYVAFGANGRYVYKPMTGPFKCDRAAFGDVDPVPGVVKACYFANFGLLAPAASETLQADGIVAYGNDGVFIYKEIHGNFSCDETTFGDPSPGKSKACYTLTDYKFVVAEDKGPLVLEASEPFAYGANGKFVFNVAPNAGTFNCNNTDMAGGPQNDPAPGVVKGCYRLNALLLAEEGSGWGVPAASASQAPAVPEVKYGSGNNGNFLSSNGPSGTCNNEFFGGDPHYYVKKRCWSKGVTAAPKGSN